jgi:hypothetical protein
MTKSKSQTDAEMLEGAAKDNNEISEVRVRHTDSVHPHDCSCAACILLRNKGPQNEDIIKSELDWSE